MKKLRLGLAVLFLMVGLALVFGDAGRIDTSLRCLTPSREHLFGCDSLGRDLFSRSLQGALVSLTIGLASAFLAVSLGLLLAVFSSGGGITSSFARGFSDSMKVLPPVILALLLVALWGSGVVKVVLAISLSASASVARTLTGVLSTLLAEDHMVATKALGLRKTTVLRRHIVPMLFPFMREHFASIALSAVLTESSLSYLGLGVSPTTPTLGAILSEGRSMVLSHQFLVVLPSIFLLVLSFSLLSVSRGLSEIDSSLQ